MKKNITYLLLNIFILLIFIYTLIYVNNELKIYNINNIIFLIIITELFLFFYLFKKYDFAIIFSFFQLISLLFLREEIVTDNYFNLNIYLDYWLSHINNKTVLINILGNVILFIPFSLVLYKKIKTSILSMIIVIILIILLETFQAIFHLGIFDIVDIILNIFGIIILFIGEKLCRIIIYQQRTLKQL